MATQSLSLFTPSEVMSQKNVEILWFRSQPFLPLSIIQSRDELFDSKGSTTCAFARSRRWLAYFLRTEIDRTFGRKKSFERNRFFRHKHLQNKRQSSSSMLSCHNKNKIGKKICQTIKFDFFLQITKYVPNDVNEHEFKIQELIL